MERGAGWVQKLTTDLHMQALPGLPVLELAGDRRVLIECHCGVTAYTSTEIGVQVRFGGILIRGNNLCLVHMSRERLVISGKIDSIELSRRGKNAGNG